MNCALRNHAYVLASGGILTWWFSEAALVHNVHLPALRLSHTQLTQTKAEERLVQRLSKYCHQSLLQFVDVSSLEGQLSGVQEPLELVQVHIIVRHGDRSPAHKFEMGPKQNFTCGLEGKSWGGLKRFAVKPLPPASKINLANFPVFPGPSKTPCGVGMLTDLGFKQHHTLGAMVRKMYHAISSTVNKPDQMFVHSTSFQRTVQSAAAFLHGYLRDDEARVPIHVSEGDLLSSPPIGVKTYPPCRNLGVFYSKTHKRAPDIGRWQALVEAVQALFRLSFDLDTGEAAIKLADHLMARLCHQFPLPCNAKSQCLNESSVVELIGAADMAWRYRYAHEYSVVAMLPFLQHSLEAMDALVQSKHAYKLLLSFAHDSTIAMMLDALGAKEDTWMPYASRLVIELWRSRKADHAYFVRVLFNGRDLTDHIGKQLLSTGYPGLIEYDRWRSALRAERSTTLYQECVNMTTP